MDKNSNKLTFQCIYCNKNYKRKTCYNNHINICRLLSNNDEFKIDLEERENTPCTKDLYKIISELTKEVYKIKKELNKFKRQVNYQKKKISVIDYLNTNYKPNISYEEWKKNIIITQDDLNYIFKYGCIKGIISLLKNNFVINYSSKILPIISTNHTLNNLYIYSNNCWILMSQEQFKNLLKIINKKIFYEFKKWDVESKKKLTKDEYSELYILNIQKLICGKYSKEQIQLRINTDICNILRVTLNNNNNNIINKFCN